MGVVVGAGIAGLVATITLAEECLKEQQQQQQQQQPSQERASFTITLIEANSFVGGRIRTVVSNTDTETKIDEKSTVDPLMFNNDRLSSIQKVDSFAPWPVA